MGPTCVVTEDWGEFVRSSVYRSADQDFHGGSTIEPFSSCPERKRDNDYLLLNRYLNMLNYDDYLI